MNKLDPGKISSAQLTFLLTAYILGTSTLLTPGSTAGNDAWLAVPIGILESLFLVWIYIALTKRYPGKTLVEINDAVYGPYLGKIVSLLYILFFLHLAGLVVTIFVDFLNPLLPRTPSTVISISILLICAWGIKCGIEVITRTSIIVVPLIIAVYMLDTILIIPKMDLSNLLPILDISALQFFKASHSAAIFPFGETVVFLMIYTFVNQWEEAGKSAVHAFLFTGLLFFITILRNISVLGAIEQDLVFPSFYLVTLINIADVITRLDILIGVSILAVVFVKAAVLYYSSVLGIAQMLKMKSYQTLVLPVGALILNLSLISYENFPDAIENTVELYSFYALPFILFLPLLTLITAHLRKA